MLVSGDIFGALFARVFTFVLGSRNALTIMRSVRIPMYLPSLKTMSTSTLSFSLNFESALESVSSAFILS